MYSLKDMHTLNLLKKLNFSMFFNTKNVLELILFTRMQKSNTDSKERDKKGRPRQYQHVLLKKDSRKKEKKEDRRQKNRRKRQYLVIESYKKERKERKIKKKETILTNLVKEI